MDLFGVLGYDITNMPVTVQMIIEEVKVISEEGHNW